MKAKVNSNFTIVDVETTGMRPGFHRIIDIGIIRIENEKVVKRYQSLINPEMHIFSVITSITGITEDDIVKAPLFEDIAHEIYELFEDSVFVAHNASFDYGFIKHEFRRIGIDFKKECLCSVKLSRALYPEEPSHNLDAVIRRHGFICDIRHRAMPDADVILQFLEYAKTKFGKDHLGKTIDSIMFSDGRSLLIDRKEFIKLPDGPGVYFFYGRDDELLYVGKSKNIRTRVRSHFSDAISEREKRLCGETARIESITTSGELSALMYESDQIKRHAPVYNRALRKIKKLIVAEKVYDDQGYATVQFSSSDILREGRDIVGLFRNLSQAKKKLRELSREHHLCEKLLGLEKGYACFGSQLGMCAGACIGKESPAVYNLRFDEAFKSRRIRTWPYPGPITIEEKGKDMYTGTVFIVNDWRLIRSFVYEEGEEREFIKGTIHFDYDIYKILARYILNPINTRSIRNAGGDDSTLPYKGEPVIEYE